MQHLDLQRFADFIRPPALRPARDSEHARPMDMLDIGAWSGLNKPSFAGTD